MSKLKRVREEAVEREQEGLRDGGHVYLSCSSCRAILVDIFITRPHEPDVWKTRATCPWCGDKSFATEVKGGFHPGGYGKINDDSPEDDVPSTVIDYSDIEGDTIIHHVLKASPDARPLYR